MLSVRFADWLHAAQRVLESVTVDFRYECENLATDKVAGKKVNCHREVPRRGLDGSRYVAL